MEPVAAAVFSFCLLGKRLTPADGMALAIIVAGILMLTSKGNLGGGRSSAAEAAAAEGDDHRVPVSTLLTMAAVSCNALRNVVIKKSGLIPPRRTLFTCSVAAGAIGASLMLLRFISRRWLDVLLLDREGGAEASAVAGAGQHGRWLSQSGVNAALCFVGYNFASFNLLASLTPVGHAVGNSVKRIVMFWSGIALLGEVMTARQLVGTAVALFGVAVYNVASKLR